MPVLTAHDVYSLTTGLNGSLDDLAFGSNGSGQPMTISHVISRERFTS